MSAERYVKRLGGNGAALLVVEKVDKARRKEGAPATPHYVVEAPGGGREILPVADAEPAPRETWPKPPEYGACPKADCGIRDKVGTTLCCDRVDCPKVKISKKG